MHCFYNLVSLAFDYASTAFLLDYPFFSDFLTFLTS